MKTLPEFLSAAAFATFIGISSAAAQSADAFMTKGDAADRSFRAQEALQSYLPAEKMEPDNVSLLLKISRQYRHLLADTGSAKEKIRLGNLALTYDRKAAQLAPGNSEAQLSSAITYGKMLPHLGKKEQVAASPLIKSAADKSIRLNSRNDNAWHVLGRWHQSLAKVSGLKRSIGGMLYGDLPAGSYDESVACFKKAIAINPNRLRHHVEIGRTYALMGQKDAALQSLQKGLAMPNREKDDPEIKGRGKESLAQLK